ncbi:MAG: FkbM family methyltransferase [Lentisphaeria bacterium]|nr:FkbM family methyltransferase [Lentisphaeria bacterium]
MADSIRMRLKQNPHAVDELVAIMADRKSRDIVRYQIEVILSMPTLKLRGNFLFRPSTILTADETDDWNRRMRNKPQYAEKYNNAFDDYNSTEFFYHHGLVFLDEAVKARLRSGVFVDAGSFDGASVMVMHNYRPSMVYGFEPSTENIARCRNNISKIGAENTSEFIQCCVGNLDGTVSFSDTGDSQAGINAENTEPSMPITKLDTFVNERKIPRIHWLKADLEGAGKEMIHGAEQTNRRDRPHHTLGTYHNAEEFFDIPQLLREWVPEYRLMYRRCQCNPITAFLEMTLIAYIP